MADVPADAVESGVDDLQARLRFETFFADLTSRLLRAQTRDLPAEIDRGLTELLDVLDIDRCSLGLFSADQRSLVIEHTVSRPGVASHKGKDFAVAFPWYTEELRRGHRLVFNFMVDELPPEAKAEREFAARTGLRSHTVLPVAVGGRILGALGVASVTKVRVWSREFLSRMELLAAVVAQALYRHHAEERITAAEGLNRAILRALPSEVVVLDGDGRLLSMNETARRCLASDVGTEIVDGMDYLAALAGMAEPDPGPSSVVDGIRSVVERLCPSFEGTYAHRHHDGVRHHLVHAVPLDEQPGTLVVHTDVTDREETKLALEGSLGEVQALKERLEAENVILHQEVRHVHGFETIVGRSAALGRVLSQIEQVAPTDSPVFLLGETGTGKDLVALALHDRSRRRDRPIISVNCAALPPTLIESELFGYERGAFTGALQRTPGRFEVADRGTIFLDEVAELPLEVQAKLLRVLQSGEFERLGSPRPQRTDVRIIAATNRDIEREMREGRFRADLYYRLSVFPVSLPPLRDRPEDIPLLVWHFVSRKQGRMGKTIKRVPDRLMRALTAYAWPGNVRELENVVERALILSEGTTLAADAVLLSTAREDVRAAGGGTLEEVERAHIRAVLAECNWKVAGPGNAADRLGLNRSTLQFRMKKLGIDRPVRERD